MLKPIIIISTIILAYLGMWYLSIQASQEIPEGGETTIVRECVLDTDCELSPEYSVSSICPYETKCMENKCSTVCGEVTEWDRIKQAIGNCSVESVSQTHALKVEVELKNGDRIEAFEPKIDDVFNEVNVAKEKCGDGLILMTE